jgi:hypothetical protein
LIDSAAESTGDLENSSLRPIVSVNPFKNSDPWNLPPLISCRNKKNRRGIEKRMVFMYFQRN